MRRCVFIQDVTGGWRHGQGSNPPPVGKRVPLHRARPFRNLGDLALAMRAGAGQVQYTKHCSCHCCTRFVAPRIQTPWIWYLDFSLLLLDIWIFLLPRRGEGRRGQFASRVDEWNCNKNERIGWCRRSFAIVAFSFAKWIKREGKGRLFEDYLTKRLYLSRKNIVGAVCQVCFRWP